MPREGKTSLTIDDETYRTLKPIKDEHGLNWDKFLLALAGEEYLATIAGAGPLPDLVAEAVAERVDLEIGVDGERIAELVAARTAANDPLDEDRIIEALRQEVRDGFREMAANVGGQL